MTQDELDTENVLGTIRQMQFFDAFRRLGVSEETCIQHLMRSFTLSHKAAKLLLYRIGRIWECGKLTADKLEAGLTEKGKQLLGR